MRRAPLTALCLGGALALSPTVAHGAEVALDKADGIVVLSTAIGTGLRFNNPYRLSTVLGSSAEGVSQTASYLDVSGGFVWGRGHRFRHGAAIHCAFAISGIAQYACAPGYLLYRRTASWSTFARIGPAFVATPSFAWGGELGAGAAWFPLAGVGIVGELVGNLFYGAGTREVPSAAYPVLSAQLGVTILYEVMP